MAKKTEYQLPSSVNEGILEIIITGKITANTVKKIDEQIVALFKTTETRVLLIDFRAVRERLGITEAYFHVRDCPPELRRVDIALVDLEENADHRSFYETMASNAGLRTKWFTDIDTARNWLKSRQR